MKIKTRQRLLDALESCQTIRGYTDRIDFATYVSDRQMRDAVERRLGIIGETLHRGDAGTGARQPASRVARNCRDA